MTYDSYSDNYELTNFVSYEDDWIGDLLNEDVVEDINPELLEDY